MRFTEINLRYATPYAKARSMVEVMNKHMPDGRYRVVEVFSGIGCNTMAFMECRRIVVTDAYEGDSLTAQRLASNVAAWATVLQCRPPRVHASTANVYDVATTSKGAIQNTAVFFDPPWGDDPPYVNPLSFKLADGSTVEECAMQLLTQPGVLLVAVKVPKGTFPVNPLPDNVVLERYTSLKKMDLLCFKCK
jgi:hypothetical protein